MYSHVSASLVLIGVALSYTWRGRCLGHTCEEIIGIEVG